MTDIKPKSSVMVQNPETGEMEPVKVKVAPLGAPGRRAPSAIKAAAIRQAYAEGKDEMIKAAEEPKAEPVEVWLTQGNMEITCMVAREDESTTRLDVDSLSMRGAQREITGYLIAHGYTPAGRWEYPEENECVRQFKAGPGATGV